MKQCGRILGLSENADGSCYQLCKPTEKETRRVLVGNFPD